MNRNDNRSLLFDDDDWVLSIYLNRVSLCIEEDKKIREKNETLMIDLWKFYFLKSLFTYINELLILPMIVLGIWNICLKKTS